MSKIVEERRSFLKGSLAAAVATSVPVSVAAAQPSASAPAPSPNILIFHSDQFRWDFVGANGLNGTTRTPTSMLWQSAA